MNASVTADMLDVPREMVATPPSSSDVVDALHAAPLLAGLSPAARGALLGAAQPLTLEPGERAFPEGCGADSLYVVRDGALEAREVSTTGESRLVRTFRPGEVLDGLQAMGAATAISVVASTRSVLAVVPGDVVDRAVLEHEDLREARERMHRRQLLTQLHGTFGPLDEALLDGLESEADWVHVSARDLLYDAGSPSRGLYIVISGRLASFDVDAAGNERLVAELARGETVGATGFFTGRPRAWRVRALRDSVLVAYDAADFERLIARHPQVVRHITAGLSTLAAAQGKRRSASPLTTIAVFAASPRASVRAFTDRLARALSAHGSVERLSAARVDALLTEPGIAEAESGTADEARLLAWLERFEARHRFVICEGDDTATPWSRRIARRADRVLLVADARESPSPTDDERRLIAESAHPSLVLLHEDGKRLPRGTRHWLDARPSVHEHYHLRWQADADLARLARVLAGRSVGLVLGGGGARGLAHIGLLRALAEAGIPVDAIGGTSMGASVAGQWAMGRDPDHIAAVSRQIFLEVRPHRGFTLPVLSLVNSRRTEEAGRLCYGETEIEDLWLPFFCNSSSLTTAEVVLHRRGKLRLAALASMSLPGVGIPVLHERQLLVDGAVLNNLPTEAMRRMGYATVIASSVSVEATTAFTCDRVPTTWEAVRTRFRKRGALAAFPSILDVVLRASLLHSAYREQVSVGEADLAVQANVAEFGLLEFEQIDAIVDAGYAQSRQAIDQWRRSGASVFQST